MDHLNSKFSNIFIFFLLCNSDFGFCIYIKGFFFLHDQIFRIHNGSPFKPNHAYFILFLRQSISFVYRTIDSYISTPEFTIFLGSVYLSFNPSLIRLQFLFSNVLFVTISISSHLQFLLFVS